MCPRLNFEEKASASASEGSGPVEEWVLWEASRPRPSYVNLAVCMADKLDGLRLQSAHLWSYLVKGLRYSWAPARVVGRVIGNKREAPHEAEVLHRS